MPHDHLFEGYPESALSLIRQGRFQPRLITKRPLMSLIWRLDNKVAVIPRIILTFEHGR